MPLQLIGSRTMVKPGGAHGGDVAGVEAGDELAPRRARR